MVVILGPTASGKSALAVDLARRFGGEIISADSRQVYKGLDIGSGKVTKREMRAIPHHLLDVASPRRTFTVAAYQRHAGKALRGIVRRGKVPIICGGTGLYIDALLNGTVFPRVKPDLALRRKLEKRAAEDLFAELTEKDPRRAQSVDQRNKRRLIRALEIIATTGRPVPSLQARKPAMPVLKLGLLPSSLTLHQKIHRRLAKRVRHRMVGEARSLHRQGMSWKKMEAFGLEYRYVSRYLQGKLGKTAMLEELEKEIRHYARRQVTWFKRDKEVIWLADQKGAGTLVRRFLSGT